MLREADGRAYLGKAWERVLGARRLRLIPEPSVETRAEACRRRFSLDTIFTHPLDRIAAGAAFDRADILLLSQRGDDCSPLFFVDGTGTPAGLSSIERAEEEVFFSPVRTMEGDDTLSLADILPSAFDHLVVGRQIARFDLSPEP